jgi:hypothetical protein
MLYLEGLALGDIGDGVEEEVTIVFEINLLRVWCCSSPRVFELDVVGGKFRVSVTVVVFVYGFVRREGGAGV